MAKKKNNSSQAALSVIVVLCLAVVAVIALCGKFPAQTPDVPQNTDSASVDHTDVQQPTNLISNQPTENHTEKPNSSSGSVSGSDTNTASFDPTTDTPPIQTTDPEPSSGYQSKNNTASFSKDAWYMLLVNGANPLPKNYTLPSMSKVQNQRLMDDRCVDDMKAMIAAAKKDGIDLLICSAYRSYSTQESNFNNKMQSYLKQGYSEEKAFAETARIIAVPGSSEHHTGLAADIVTPSYQNLNSGFAKTDAFQWLYAHCTEYGFILRYPEDKQDITKIIYEPWHYRYVGKEAAEIIMKEGLCLEEFLDKYGT